MCLSPDCGVLVGAGRGTGGRGSPALPPSRRKFAWGPLVGEGTQLPRIPPRERAYPAPGPGLSARGAGLFGFKSARC